MSDLKVDDGYFVEVREVCRRLDEAYGETNLGNKDLNKYPSKSGEETYKNSPLKEGKTVLIIDNR